MASTQWKYGAKLSVQMPKVEVKDNSPAMKKRVSKALSRGTQKASAYVEKGLKVALDKSMTSLWTWTDGSRDIVDTGKLKNSLKLTATFNQTKVSWQVQYRTPYAAFVHYGGVIKPYGNKNARDVLIPARPWVQAVLEGSNGQEKFDLKTPFDAGMAEAFAEAFG
jgi:phage gpG-like protein